MAPSVRSNSLLDLTKIAPLLCPGDDGDDELLDNLRSYDITDGLPDLGMWTTLDQVSRELRPQFREPKGSQQPGSWRPAISVLRSLSSSATVAWEWRSSRR
jgi:hypothetical protein